MKQSLKKMNKAVLALCVSGLLVALAGCTQAVTQENTQSSAQKAELTEEEMAFLAAPVFDITTEDRRTEPAGELKTATVSEDGIVQISGEGDYLLKDLEAEKIIVEAEEKVVHLFFDGVRVDSPTGPALEVKSAGKLVITLTDGSDNRLEDSGRFESGVEEDSCIYSETDITVNGSGSLTVFGFYNDSIHAKGKIKLLGGDYYFKAKRSGLRGNKGVFIDAGELTFETEKEGILTKKNGDNGKGTVQIMGGSLNMVCGRNCISSAHDILISGCRIRGKGVPGLAECSGRYIVGEGCIDE